MRFISDSERLIALCPGAVTLKYRRDLPPRSGIGSLNVELRKPWRSIRSSVLVWKIDRFGRSVLHLNQQLAALSSYGVRFIATSQSLDTDQSNPTSRLLLQILASVAEFEREMIRERTLMGASRRQGQWQACWPSQAGVSPG